MDEKSKWDPTFKAFAVVEETTETRSRTNLSFSLGRVRFAVSINVFTNFDVGHLSSLDRDGSVAQWTHRDLNVLQ